MASLPDPETLRAGIDEHIGTLRELGLSFNPLQLLSRVALHHLLTPAEGMSAPHEQSEAQVEYLLNLFLASTFPAQAPSPSPSDIQKCIDVLADFHSQATVYYALNTKAKSGDRNETELILLQRLQTLHVRGDAYQKHYQQTFQGIASQHDEFLKNAYGFTSEDLWQATEHIYQSVQRAIGAAFEALESGLMESGNAQGAIDGFGGPEVFEVVPRDDQERNIFQMLCIGFGENAEFWDGIPRWRGWPLNPSKFLDRPLVRHNHRYYAFHLPRLLRNTLSIVESLIRQANAGYWQNTFLKRRDDYVEAEAIRLIAGLLPGCTAYSNLYYGYKESGEDRRAELDGLIVFDDCLLIVEVKASGLSDASKRGAPDSLRTDLAASLDKAYSQAQRVLNVIRSTAEVAFTDAAGADRLKLRFTDYKRVFLISVTREHFASLATQLHIVRKLGFIQGVEWPWAVCLDDLRVMADMFELGALFLHYLTRRVAINEHEKLATVDEIDLLGLFFDNGLYPESLPNFQDSSMILLSGFSDPFDEYYRDVSRGRTVEKPKYPLPDRMRRLLGTLQKFRPRHFATGSLHLLAYGSTAQDQIDSFLPRCEKGLSRNRETLLVMGDDKRQEAPLLTFACAVEGTALESQLIERARQHKAKAGSSEGALFIWMPPLTSGKLRVCLL